MRVYRVPCVPDWADSTAWIEALSFSPDGTRLAVTEEQNFKQSSYNTNPFVRWLDLATGEVCLERRFTRAYALALSPDHTRLVVGRSASESRQVTALELVESASGAVRPVREVPNYLPRSAAWSPDGSRFAVGIDNWNPHRHEAGEPSYALVGLDDQTGTASDPIPLSWWSVLTLAFSPDGRWIATAGRGGFAIVIEWPTGERVGQFPVLVTHRIRFAPTGPLLAVAGTKSVVVWDAPAAVAGKRSGTGRDRWTLQRGHTERITDFAWAPDGAQILTGSTDETARVWSLAKRKCVRSFAWDIGPISAVAWAPDGLKCAAAGTEGRVVVWDVDG